MALTAVYAYSLLLSAHVRAVRALRHARGIRRTPLCDLPFHLIPSILNLEFPHKPPNNAILAGPMVVPVPPLNEDGDAFLHTFLNRRRTVLFNMGTLFEFTPADVEAAADAFLQARHRLATSGGMQVLWKLPRAESFGSILDEKLHGEDRDAILVQEWIGPPSLAVLQHPNIMVSIHHGGASTSAMVHRLPDTLK